MKRYRKKPVTIEAVQFLGGVENATTIIDWILDHGGTARYHEATEALVQMDAQTGDLRDPAIIPEHIAIDTLEGTMRCEVLDWAIKGIEDEFYPCKPAIFLNSYEADGE